MWITTFKPTNDHWQTTREGIYYKLKGDFKNMVKYYEMAIERNDTDAMNSLADYYKECGKITNMKKYYDMAISKGDLDAMFNLAEYYKEIGAIVDMQKYQKMIKEAGYIC